jgi:hypothetical protein
MAYCDRCDEDKAPSTGAPLDCDCDVLLCYPCAQQHKKEHDEGASR